MIATLHLLSISTAIRSLVARMVSPRTRLAVDQCSLWASNDPVSTHRDIPRSQLRTVRHPPRLLHETRSFSRLGLQWVRGARDGGQQWWGQRTFAAGASRSRPKSACLTARRHCSLGPVRSARSGAALRMDFVCKKSSPLFESNRIINQLLQLWLAEK